MILHYCTLLLISVDYCALRYITKDYCRFLQIPMFSQAACDYLLFLQTSTFIRCPPFTGIYTFSVILKKKRGVLLKPALWPVDSIAPFISGKSETCLLFSLACIPCFKRIKLFRFYLSSLLMILCVWQP